MNKKNIIIKLTVVFSLFLVMPFFSACSYEPRPLNLGGTYTTLADVVIEFDESTVHVSSNPWVQVAQDKMPTVVAITSQSSENGSTSSGSGIIMTEDGYIVTNAHVIDDLDNIINVFFLDDSTSHPATIIGMDIFSDIAVIKINTTDDLPVATFANSDNVLIAEGVMAIGYPGGINNPTVTTGIVSALNRPINMGNGFSVNVIQSDAAINPGNSGGALVNEIGQVIGMPTSKIAGTLYEGIGYSIPSKVILEIANDLIEHGVVTGRASIGITIDLIPEGHEELHAGLHVLEIHAQQAYDAGLMIGDVITEINGQVINSFDVVRDILNDSVPGDIINTVVYRDGSYINIDIILSNYNEVFG